jgi:hypothetical protein
VRTQVEILCGFFATCTADHFGDPLMFTASLPFHDAGILLFPRSNPCSGRARHQTVSQGLGQENRIGL